MILLNKAKNYYINGAMDFFQRGLSFTNVPGGTFVADRLKLDRAGTMTYNTSRDTVLVPTVAQANFNFSYSLGTIVTTAQTVLGASDYAQLIHAVEGLTFSPLAGRKLTFSFWVRMPPGVGGTFPITFKNAAATRSYVSTYTVATDGLWSRKSVTFTHDPSGVWNYGTGAGMFICFGLASGTNFNAPALNTWTSGNYLSHASCNNFSASTANSISLTGLQLEEGVEASNFERAGGNIANELMLCQRYFEKTYPVDMNPGTSSTDSALVTRSSGTDAGACDVSWHYKVPKRVLPSGVIYNPSTGVVGTWTGTGTPVATINTGINSSRIYSSGASVANSNYSIHATADAEL